MTTYTPAPSHCYIPKFKAGENPHALAAADITAGQILEVGTGGVAPAEAGSLSWVGVAAADASAGNAVGWWRSGVQRLHTTAALTPGELVQCGADGTAAAYEVGTDAPEALLGVVIAATIDGTVTVQLTR